MADDVKVKFGGDFSGVSEGAGSAAKVAGTAIASSFKDYAKSISSSIADMFSISNIMGKLFESMKEAGQYFREIDELSRKLNVSREDLQKFGRIGREVGLSMETIGRSIQFANKNIGAAITSAGKQRDTLMALGFTEKEVTEGKVKAIDVMMKLSAEYDKHINFNVIAKHTTDMFGRSGGDLTKILSQGTSALKERIDTLRVYTDAEVKAAAAADRAREAAAKTVAGVGKRFEIGMGEFMTRLLVGKELITGPHIPSIQERAEKPGAMWDAAKEMSKNLTGILTKEQIANDLIRRADLSIRGDEKKEKYYALANVLNTMAEKERQNMQGKNLPPSTETNQLGAQTVSVSSLQAIGGGDIGSIMSGFHVDIQQEQLDVQKQIATNTAATAASPTKTIVPVAK